MADTNNGEAYIGGAALLDLIPQVAVGSTRILDFGCGNGSTLMRLKKERGCTELYGVDIRKSYEAELKEKLDEAWIMDLGEPDIELDDKYLYYFNYILMLDVVEHLYDPWYVLPKVARYLAPSGKLIISVPNFRNWGLWFNVVLGEFSYGKPGGIMNEEHIRWFTFDSLKELIAMSGLVLRSAQLTFPPNVDIAMMRERVKTPIAELEIPPPETKDEVRKTTIRFAGITDISAQYPYFLANKIIAICGREETITVPEPILEGALEERRKRLSKR